MERALPPAIRWEDEFEITADRVVFTKDELFIPGLRTFGHHVMRTATPALQLHYHEDAFELVLVVSGDVHFAIGDTEYNPSTGELYLVQPSVPHSTNNKPMIRSEIYWFQLETTAVTPLFLSYQAGRTVMRRLRGAGNAVLRLSTQQLQLVAEAFSMARVHYFQERYCIAACLALFLTTLTWEAPQRRQPPSPDISRAVAYVRAHVREEVPLETLAEVAGLSLSRFKEKFHRQMLVTPRAYINQQKIELAKTLLLDAHTVTEVAQELSFDTPAYFSSVFRKFTATTPSRFIKENIDKL